MCKDDSKKLSDGVTEALRHYQTLYYILMLLEDAGNSLVQYEMSLNRGCISNRCFVHSRGMKTIMKLENLNCPMPPHYVPIRSHPLFLAREVLGQLVREAEERSP